MEIGSFLLAVFAAFISAIGNVVLKKAATTTREKNIFMKILNLKVIVAYMLMVVSTYISLLSLKKMDLRFAPAASATNYFWVPLLSFFFLGEKINKKQLVGICIILLGVIITCAF